MADPDSQATVVSTGGLGAGRGRLGGPVFLSGDMVAGRYRVARFLAKGGMGEVYEAEDTELRQPVALKTISAHIGGDLAAIERFKREIALARLVTHPNVCRIFDLGQHPLPPLPDGTAQAPITFLTMELLRGETLAARLRRDGRLRPDEALPLVEQMAGALEAAHRARVVHRDFKSENVFLVPSHEGGLRAVVTDFGVARGAEATDQFASQVTGLGIVGTPAYMAPEQVENKEITPAADIYALGIVLYEMVTARLPFESPNPLTTAIKRLKEAPPPPHVHVPDLPPYWERTILRCLERRPEDRFATCLEVAEALARPKGRSGPSTAERTPNPGPATTLLPIAPPPRVVKPRASRSTRLMLTLLAVVLVSAGLYFLNRDRERSTRQQLQMRRSVAVIQPQNLSGDANQNWIATALAEMISAEIAQGESLRAVPGQSVADARRQWHWQELAQLDAEQLRQARNLLGCDLVVAGSYLSLPNGLRVNLQVQDATSGASIKSLTAEGNVEGILPLVAQLGEELREALGTDAAGTEDPLAGQPRQADAARLYAQALDALRESRPREARDWLEQAITLEPDNPLLHSALSSAWSGLGYGPKAVDAARKALELSRGLPLEDRLSVEARLRETEGRWAEARDLYRKLFESFPDSLEYGLALAAAERNAGAPAAALSVVEGLHQLPPPLTDDPRIDLAEAEAAAQAGQFERQLAAAQKGLAKAKSRGATLLVARAWLAVAQSQRLLGQLAEAGVAAQSSLELYTQLGQSVGRAYATTAVGNFHLDQGRWTEALSSYQLAADLYREIGDQGGLAAALNNLAVTHKRQGEGQEAETLYAEAEGIYREIGDRRGLLTTLNNRGVLLVDRDRLTEAQAIFEGQKAAWQEIGGAVGAAYGLNNLAEVARLQGRLAESETLHRQALEARRAAGLKPDLALSLSNLAGVLREQGEIFAAAALLEEAKLLMAELGDRSLEATVLSQMGELQLARGEIAEARSAFDRALELRQELREASRIPPTQLAIARLAFAEGVFDETVQLGSDAREGFAAEGRGTEEARAAAWEIRGLVALGRSDEARSLEQTLQLATTSEQPELRLLTRLARAELMALRDNRAALNELDQVAREAEATGLATFSFEAHLAWANVAEAAGKRADATARRAATLGRAQALGLVFRSGPGS